MDTHLPRRVRSYIDDEDPDDGDSLTGTGSGLTARAFASDVEGPLPPPSRAPKLSVAATPQQKHQSQNADEPDEMELEITADGAELADPSRTALEREQAAEAKESTKLPPIDRGYAWIIALGKLLKYWRTVLLDLRIAIFISISINSSMHFFLKASGLITFTFVGLFRSKSVFLEPVRAHFHVNYTEIALANSASIFWSNIGSAFTRIRTIL